MLLLTQTMVQKRKTGCSNTAFCQEANRRLHSNTVSIIIENFLPTRRQQYLLHNFQQSSMYHSYHSHIPSYLHDRPRSVIIHCTRLNLELSIFYALATASIFSTLSVIFSFLTGFFLHTAMMASFNKGQLPAQQTKVVDHGLGPCG